MRSNRTVSRSTLAQAVRSSQHTAIRTRSDLADAKFHGGLARAAGGPPTADIISKLQGEQNPVYLVRAEQKLEAQERPSRSRDFRTSRNVRLLTRLRDRPKHMSDHEGAHLANGRFSSPSRRCWSSSMNYYLLARVDERQALKGRDNVFVAVMGLAEMPYRLATLRWIAEWKRSTAGRMPRPRPSVRVDSLPD